MHTIQGLHMFVHCALNRVSVCGEVRSSCDTRACRHSKHYIKHSKARCNVQSVAVALTIAVPSMSALHDVSVDLLHHLTVGQVAAIVLTLSLPLQALVCVKQ